MHRRGFSTGLLATGLAAPAILTGDKSLANSAVDNDRLGSEAVRQFSRVILLIGLQRVVITYLLVANPLALFGLDLRAPVPQFNENRVNLGRVPLLGSLFRQPLSERFNPAVFVGQVFLFQSLLMIMPQRGPVSKITRTVIAHKNLSWEPKSKPRKLRMSNIPTLGTLQKRGTLLGGAYQTKSELLVLLKPSIIELES